MPSASAASVPGIGRTCQSASRAVRVRSGSIATMVAPASRAREAGATIVAIDPLRTRTAREADWHVRPMPGTDAALALGMMHVIVAEGRHDQAYLDAHCNGWPELRRRLEEYPPERVAELTGLPS